jgi:hypothetical protein
MPKLTTFTDAHSAGHVVVALVPPDSRKGIGAAHLGDLRHLLSRLITNLAPGGDYALSINWHDGEPEIICDFERPADADRLAAAVQAETAGRYPGWKSQRTFVLDDDAATTIEKALAE